MRKSIVLLILFFLLLVPISAHAEKGYLEAKDYIKLTEEDHTNSVQSFLNQCKSQNKNAYFNQGVYRFASDFNVVSTVDILGEEGTVFQAIDEQIYITDAQNVSDITISHIIFDNISIWCNRQNSTNWKIYNNLFINAHDIDLTVSCKPDSSNKNGGTATGYYIQNKYGSMTILSNMFLRNSKSLGRGVSTYYTQDVVIQDNYFGRLEDVEGSIVSEETKHLKQVGLDAQVIDDSTDYGYFMTGINILNSDVNTKIIGNYMSFNKNITESGYEDGSQSTNGYNRDHFVYAKAFNGLDIVGNYFKGMNKNQDGGVKCRNGENLLIYRNVLEDSLILLYVQKDSTQAVLKNVDVRENIFINKDWYKNTIDIPCNNTTGKLVKYLTTDYSILYLNYVDTADVDSITIASNLFYSVGLPNEQIRIDNRDKAYALPKNITIENNKNIVGDSLRVTTRNFNGLDNVDVKDDWNNGTKYEAVIAEEYQQTNVTQLAEIRELEYQISSEGKITSSAEKIYVDGKLYQDEALTQGKKYFIFLTSSKATSDILVEETKVTIPSNLYTALEIQVNETYQVTYNINGHGTTQPPLTGVTFLPDKLPVLSEEGWIFEGWYLDSSYDTLAIGGQKISKDMILYAKWMKESEKKYTITYSINGHGIKPVDELEVTSLPNVLPVLTETGYTFGGWYVDASCTTKALAGQALTSDITLYAQWIKNPYIISFVNNGHGDSVLNMEVIDKLPILLPELTEEGWNFIGWFMDEALISKVALGSEINSDLTLYAKWEQIKLTVNFAYEDIENQVIPYNGKVIPPKDPVQTGYTFEGWYKEKECIHAWDFEKDLITKNTTIYPKWVLIEEPKPIPFIITFNALNQTELKTQTINQGEKVIEPLNPQKKGYIFSGWYVEAECIHAWDFNQKPTEDMTLYAKWTLVEQPTKKDNQADLITVLSVSLSVGIGVLGLCVLAILVIRKKRS